MNPIFHVEPDPLDALNLSEYGIAAHEIPPELPGNLLLRVGAVLRLAVNLPNPEDRVLLIKDVTTLVEKL